MALSIMFNSIIRSDVLITSDDPNYFLGCVNAKFHEGIEIYTVAAEDKVYIQYISNSISKPIVCKVLPDLKDIHRIAISDSLDQIACVSSDSTVAVISIQPILNLDSYKKIQKKIPKFTFPLSDLNFSIKKEIQFFKDFLIKLPQNEVMDAFWWSTNNSNYIVIINTNGVLIHSLIENETRQAFIPISGASKADYRQNGNKSSLMVSTKNEAYIIKLNGDEKQTIDYTVNRVNLKGMQNPKMMFHLAQSDTKWYISIVNNHLKFYDNDLKPINISKFSTTCTLTSSIAITKHFIFHCTVNAVYVRFISVDGEHPLLTQSAQIKVVDFENDIVILYNNLNVIRVHFRTDPELIFKDTIRKGMPELARRIATGFGFKPSQSSFMAAEEFCLKGNFLEAMELIYAGGIITKAVIELFYSSGGERYALHMINRIPFENGDTIRALLKKKLSIKYRVFGLFQEHKYISHPSEWPSLIESAPDALKFRYLSLKQIPDTKLLKSASALDIPHASGQLPVEYCALTSTYLKTLPRNETELPLPICSQLSGRIYISQSNLFVDGEVIMQNAGTFARVGSTLFVLLTKGSLLVTDLPSLVFRSLDVYPSLLMKSGVHKVATLSIVGVIFVVHERSIFNQYPGSYVDVAIGADDVVYGLREDGAIVSVENDTVIDDSVFYTRIFCAGSIVMGLTLLNDIVCSKYNFQKHLEFVPEVIKSGPSAAIIAGHGSILEMRINGNGNFIEREQKYTERIGNLLDVFAADGGFVVCGSAASPMHVSPSSPKIPSPTIADFALFANSYDKELLLNLFQRSSERVFLCPLINDWEHFPRTNYAELLKNIELMPDPAETFHHIFEIDNSLCGRADEVLKTDTACESFLRHPEDLEKLSSKQLALLIQPPIRSLFHKPLDLFRFYPPTYVPSIKLKEKKLFVFSCGHSMSARELQSASLAVFKKIKIGSILTNEYQMLIDGKTDHIPCQCPLCLFSELSKKDFVL